ncbi:MAG: hypothetical protein ACLFRN_06290, partial [Halothece sp.]
LNSSYKIKSYLTDRTTQTQTVIYHCIPSREIKRNRRNNSENKIKKLNNDHRLKEFEDNLQKIPDQKNATRLARLLKKTAQNIGKEIELFQYIDPDSYDPLVRKINQLIIDKIKPLIKEIKKELPTHTDNFNRMQPKNKERLKRAIIFFGKLYAFSKHFDLSDFFTPKIIHISQTIRENDYHKEYLQFLARTAVKTDYKKKYFNLFDEYYHQENSTYLWGYVRILLWYYSFDKEDYKIIDYRDHFIKLSDYLLSKNPDEFDDQYRPDAFLSLIYLLTFSEHDSNFFTENSEEKQKAQQIVSHYESANIPLKQLSNEKSFHEILSDLITGNATQEEVSKLIEAT